MRAIIMDTNREGKITYDLESIRKQMKDQDKIAILLERTSFEEIDRIDPKEIIGYLEHISLHKGIYRGDVVIVQEEFKELVDAYVKVDHFHLALNADATKDEINGNLKITKINKIYYAYMEKNLDIEGEIK